MENTSVHENVVQYEVPEIEKVQFDTQATTVLGNCTGWKSSVKD